MAALYGRTRREGLKFISFPLNFDAKLQPPHDTCKCLDKKANKMKKINAKIYSDEDFPGKFFIKHDNGRVEVANVVTPKCTAQRGGYAFFFRDADKKSRNISEQRVQRAIDERKPLLQVRYITKAESRSVKENTLLKRLLCLRRSLMAEYPGSHVAVISVLFLKALIASTSSPP